MPYYEPGGNIIELYGQLKRAKSAFIHLNNLRCVWYIKATPHAAIMYNYI